MTSDLSASGGVGLGVCSVCRIYSIGCGVRRGRKSLLHALIIDDEVSARADLREMLAAHPDVAIVGEAATITAARALLTSTDYDLVFLDVQLIGGEAFQLLSDVRPGARIVFATAHDRYAVRAFACHAVDYLLKPIDPARLAEALRRTAAIRSSGATSPHSTAGTLDASTQPSMPPARLAFSGPPAGPEDTAEVALTRDESVFLRQMLEAWEDSLRPTHHLRQLKPQPRTVRYERNTEPTRLFVGAAPVSAVRRCWRTVRARLSR